MKKKPTKKQMDTATNILVSWKKKMPFYYASAIIIVFLILIFATKDEKKMSMYQKNILDFKKAAEYIHRNANKS